MKTTLWIATLLLFAVPSLAPAGSIKEAKEKDAKSFDEAVIKDIQSWSTGRLCSDTLSYTLKTSCGSDGDCKFVLVNCGRNALVALDRVCKQSKEVEKVVTEKLKGIALSFVSKEEEAAKMEGSILHLSGWLEQRGKTFKKAHCKSPEEIQKYLEETL